MAVALLSPGGAGGGEWGTGVLSLPGALQTPSGAFLVTGNVFMLKIVLY